MSEAETTNASDFLSVPLGEIAHIEMGQSPDSRYVIDDPFVGHPFLQGNAEFGAVFPEPKYGCLRPAKLCKANDVLISVRAPVGAVNLADRDYCIGRGLAAIRVRGIKPSLVGEVIARQSSALRRVSQGTTFEAVNKSDLLTLSLKLPPKNEWAHVTGILDTLDTAIHETEAIIAKLKAVKQGLLHDLLTRGIDANGELRPPQAEAPHLYKPSPLGWIPKEWDVESIAKVCSDVVDCPHSTPHFQEQGVLVARTMHIKDGIFLESLASRVSELQYHDRITRLEPQGGDLIFTREAPVGEAFIVPSEMRICLGQRVMLLRPKNGKLVADYLLAQIYSGAVKDRIGSLTSGTTNPHLNVSEVKDFKIPVPLFDEQQLIADRMQSLETRLRYETDEQQKFVVLKSGLMDDLLTGRVRVTPLLAEAAQQQGSA
ncbi:restriction endonuclease subunit S [Acidithiobacillus albertensis]|uniref:restriction endonuclease subunit S n=1 Tax=Acidithiobacillus albertensis TaxID=119978 RepID=UPI00094B4A44|nr:restriction endonuclease subunit S [Acidithiobacillus albertensis]